MSGLTISPLKTALADQIQAYVLATRPTTCRGYRKPPATRPCVTIDVEDITYFGTFGPAGLSEVKLVVKLWVSTADEDSDEVAMFDYLSVGTGNGASIVDAINSNKTLGGLVDSCVCLEVRNISDESGGDDYTAEFPVTIACKKIGAQP